MAYGIYVATVQRTHHRWDETEEDETPFKLVLAAGSTEEAWERIDARMGPRRRQLPGLVLTWRISELNYYHPSEIVEV